MTAEKPKETGLDCFMGSAHYHCRNCGGQIEFLTRIGWQVGTGVLAIGVCKRCKLFMVESETGAPKWVPIL